MKKNFVFAMLFAVAVVGSSYANDPVKVKSIVKESFQKTFTGAEGVTWEVVSSKQIFHASFVYNNESLNAYFDAEGNLLATGRYVKRESLPMLVNRGLTENYGRYNVIETIEFVANSETSYIVKVGNDKVTMYVQAYNDGSSAILKKEKKNNVTKL